MGNEQIGISKWLSDTLTPLFAGISPIVFVLIMVLIVDVLTNFCSNSVALSVVFAIAIPLCMSLYDGRLRTMSLSIMVISSTMSAQRTFRKS